MVKCPYCGYSNEEGSLFCEQCKSDLTAPTVPMAGPAPVAEAIPAAEFILSAPAAEAVSATAQPAVPVAEAVPATPTIPTAESPVIASAAPVAEAVPSATPVAEAIPTAVPTSPTAPVAEPPPPSGTATAPASSPPGVAAPTPAAPTAPVFPPGTQPRLKVIRGMKIGDEFPIYEGESFIGRADEKPVDIDLEYQEPPDRVWTSRQHAVIIFENGQMHIEDLNSANGTYVNRQRVYPGQKQPLKPGDVIQIGTVQMRVIV